MGEHVVGEGQPGRGVIELDVTGEGGRAGQDHRCPVDEEDAEGPDQRPPGDRAALPGIAEAVPGDRQGHHHGARELGQTGEAGDQTADCGDAGEADPGEQGTVEMAAAYDLDEQADADAQGDEDERKD